MALPKVLYERLRRTKGTRVFVVRNYFGLGFILSSTILGLALREAKLFKDYRTEYEEGVYDETPEMKRRKLLFRTVGLPVSSKQLEEERELERTSMPVDTRMHNSI